MCGTLRHGIYAKIPAENQNYILQGRLLLIYSSVTEWTT